MLFFTYDLETYRDQMRGLYFDFEAQAPGPLVRTTDELAAALGELAGLQDPGMPWAAAFLSGAPAGETTVQRVPLSVMPCPFVWPAAESPENV